MASLALSVVGISRYTSLQGHEIRQFGHVSAAFCPPLNIVYADRLAYYRTRRRDTKMFYPKTEKEVFDLLDLDWVDPVWRDADA